MEKIAHQRWKVNAAGLRRVSRLRAALLYFGFERFFAAPYDFFMPSFVYSACIPEKRSEMTKTAAKTTRTNRILFYATAGLVVAALAASVLLLASDTGLGVSLGLSMTTISSAPLLLAGISFLAFQSMLRPRPSELLKNTLLAGTFILWGIVQTMPQGALSARLGDLVIVLYVLDLAWVILAGIASQQGQNG